MSVKTNYVSVMLWSVFLIRSFVCMLYLREFGTNVANILYNVFFINDEWFHAFFLKKQLWQ